MSARLSLFDTETDRTPDAHAAVALVPLVFVVPMPANVTNRSRGSTHWRRGHREKLDYWEMLDAHAAACRLGRCIGSLSIPRAPAAPLLRVTLSSSMVLRGGMDDENAAARHKPLVDWLVTRGYLATDRRERKKDGASCRWAAFPEQRVTRKPEDFPRITLTITPVTEP